MGRWPTFDITMDHPVLVQECKSHQQFPHDQTNVDLFQRLGPRLPIISTLHLLPTSSHHTPTHKRPDTPTLGVLHDDPHFRALHQTPIILDHIRHRPSPRASHQLLQQRHLFLDIPDIVVLGIQVDDLESYYMARLDMPALVHGSVRAFADNLDFLARSALP
jgi:hypothetical protein